MVTMKSSKTVTGRESKSAMKKKLMIQNQINRWNQEQSLSPGAAEQDSIQTDGNSGEGIASNITLPKFQPKITPRRKLNSPTNVTGFGAITRRTRSGMVTNRSPDHESLDADILDQPYELK